MMEKIPSQAMREQRFYPEATKLMQSGYSDWQIKTSLVQRGLDQASASTIVENLRRKRNRARKMAALQRIVVGGLVGGIGLIVTIGTYMSASGGGTYVIAWGAIVFGAIRFFQGLSDYFE